MPDRDLQDIRLVGTFALILGVVLMLLTAITAIFLVATSITTANGQVTRALLELAIALIMSVVLIGCGHAMQKIRPHVTADLENLRLVWTSLVIMMALTGLANIWLVPPLSDIAGLVLAALFLVRGAVIRLTNR